MKTKEPERMMTKAEIEKITHLKKEVNSPKRDLLRIASEIAQASPRQADQLYSIIARLEAWQNK